MEYNILSKKEIQAEVMAFKESLAVIAFAILKGRQGNKLKRLSEVVPITTLSN